MKLHHRVDGPSGAPLLVLGPSLGTTTEVWRPQLAELTASWRVLRYDLPGHGGSAPATGFTIDDLAAAVLDLVEDERFAIGGISLGGAIATTAALRVPGRVRGLVLCCTSARFGEPGPWRERAELVRAEGVAALAPALENRWFTPGFDGRWVLEGLGEVDAPSYAACCEALAAFDVTGRLGEIAAPALVIAGAEDPATPLDQALTLAGGIPGASLTVVPRAAHLAGVEHPGAVTTAIVRHLRDGGRDAGMRTRREVLGDAHVDRAIAATTGFTRDFQDLITRYAWDEIWNRPGLDRRTRSCVTLTALVAGGHLEELAMHVRAALRNGLTPDEIKEVLLQAAVYCGVPAANAAFAVARRTLDDLGSEGP
ncbi:4-carboxymuconolactone decarboxylase [Nonomuraea deserti]|uniref:4-carboxymuconolactone decarboxylase n=1 Tax=Nonomuraea deserti TaxID=1848322 RepID=A0A4R4U3R0_9ACTN|nr:4-carboxymuconolactone decarboxylase [Nonomuraea deserti]TDC85907.1 4-carboxymuconolactone decarboxylase [Nonomuraea deserti]